MTQEERSELFSLLRDGIKEGMKATGTSGGLSNRSVNFIDDLAELDAEVKSFTKNLKYSTGSAKAWVNALGAGGPAFNALAGSMDQFKHELESVERELKNVKDEEHRIAAETKKQALKEAQVRVQLQASLGVLTSAVGGLVTGFWGATKTLIMGAAEFEQGLLEGRSGNDLFTSSMITGAKAAEQGAVTTAKFVQTLGDVSLVLGLIPGLGTAIRSALFIIGGALKMFGGVTEEAAHVASELAQRGFTLLNTNVNQLIAGFKEVNSVNGILAKGLSGLYDAAVMSGMGANVKEFSSAVKNSRDNLFLLGTSFSQGVDRMSKISAILRKDGSVTGMALTALGFSIQEQAELGIETAARLKVAGDRRANDDQYVASQTVEYAKTLKILNAVTGGNAREALKNAQMELQRASWQQSLSGMSKESYNIALAGQTQIAALGNKTIETAYQQFMQTGIIRDTSAAVFFQSNREFADGLTEMREAMLAGTMSEAEARDKFNKIIVASAEESKSKLKDNAVVFTDALGAGSATVKDNAEAVTALLKTLQVRNADTVTQAEKDAAAMTNNAERLNKAYQDMIQNTAIMGTEQLSKMKDYTTEWLAWSGSLKHLREDLTSALDAVIAKLRELAGVGSPAKPMVNGAQSSQIGAGVTHAAGTVAAPTTAQASSAASAAQAHAAASAEIAKKNPSIQNRLQAGMAAQQASRLRLLENSPTARNANAQNSALGLPTDTNPLASATPTLSNPLDHIIFGANGADSGKDRFDQLDPDVKKAFLDMVSQYVQQNPTAMIKFVSGKRTWAEQEQLRLKNSVTGKPTAPPGFSKHESGRAIDIDAASWNALGPLIKSNGFKTIPGDTGHIKMETGGVVTGSREGTNVTLAENNKSELVSPLVNGMLPGMKQLIDRVDTLIALTKSQNTTQGKMLRAVA